MFLQSFTFQYYTLKHEVNSAIRTLSSVSESGNIAKINDSVMQIGKSVSKTNTIVQAIEAMMINPLIALLQSSQAKTAALVSLIDHVKLISQITHIIKL